MLFIKSKIQFFESKSQLLRICHIYPYCCLSSQRYNFLKANHNVITLQWHTKNVVYQVKDTIFWKQITTQCCNRRLFRLLFIKSKIQFFESKSQRTSTITLINFRCLSSQRYNFLKANHNIRNIRFLIDNVVYQVKDTIFWKQITTKVRRGLELNMLFIKSKIQFFESKSQLFPCGCLTLNCCLSSQRYNFLKANHNHSGRIRRASTVVYQVKDTIFWKQITTNW